MNIVDGIFSVRSDRNGHAGWSAAMIAFVAVAVNGSFGPHPGSGVIARRP
jgi:hypothetical protein